MLAVIQDRIEQKDWLAKHGFPVGAYRAVRSLDEVRAAIHELGGKCFCKSATGGYDGRGQGKVGFGAEPVTEAEVRRARGRLWAKGRAWSRRRWSWSARSA